MNENSHDSCDSPPFLMPQLDCYGPQPEEETPASSSTQRHEHPSQDPIFTASFFSATPASIRQTVVPVVGQVAPIVGQVAPALRQDVDQATQQHVAPVNQQHIAPVIRNSAVPIVRQAVAPILRQYVAPVVRQCPTANTPAVAPLVRPSPQTPPVRKAAPVAEKMDAPVVTKPDALSTKQAASTPEKMVAPPIRQHVAPVVRHAVASPVRQSAPVVENVVAPVSRQLVVPPVEQIAPAVEQVVVPANNQNVASAAKEVVVPAAVQPSAPVTKRVKAQAIRKKASKKNVQATPVSPAITQAKPVSFSDWADTYEGCGLPKPEGTPSSSAPSSETTTTNPNVTYNYSLRSRTRVGENLTNPKAPRTFLPPVEARKMLEPVKNKPPATKTTTETPEIMQKYLVQKPEEPEPELDEVQRAINARNEQLAKYAVEPTYDFRIRDPFDAYKCVICNDFAIQNLTFSCLHMACLPCFPFSMKECPKCTAEIGKTNHIFATEHFIYRKLINPILDKSLNAKQRFANRLGVVKSTGKDFYLQQLKKTSPEPIACADSSRTLKGTPAELQKMEELGIDKYEVTIYDLSGADALSIILDDVLINVAVTEELNEMSRIPFQRVVEKRKKGKKDDEPSTSDDNAPPKVIKIDPDTITFSQKLKQDLSRLGQPVILHPRVVDIPGVPQKEFRMIVSRGRMFEKARMGHLADYVQRHYAPHIDLKKFKAEINIHPIRHIMDGKFANTTKLDGSQQPVYSGNNKKVVYFTDVGENVFNFEKIWTLDAWRLNAGLPNNCVLELAYSVNLTELEPEVNADNNV